eukprot:SAG31_NODE_10_length_40133_cov_27.863041_5_plen_198_part_00
MVSAMATAVCPPPRPRPARRRLPLQRGSRGGCLLLNPVLVRSRHARSTKFSISATAPQGSDKLLAIALGHFQFCGVVPRIPCQTPLPTLARMEWCHVWCRRRAGTRAHWPADSAPELSGERHRRVRRRGRTPPLVGMSDEAHRLYTFLGNSVAVVGDRPLAPTHLHHSKNEGADLGARAPQPQLTDACHKSLQHGRG